MIDSYINNPKSPKYHVKQYLDSIKAGLKDKIVLDVPAGNGATTEILLEHGARAEPYDLFPEYFMLSGTACKRADILEGIPVGDNHADMLICQEGIEHFSDQLKALQEFNRVLKPRGELVITTPSCSNLASKISYLLFESESAKQMPPNELDDIWMSDRSITSEIYYGHIFLIGLQKLRVLAKLAGFRIKTIQYVRLSKGSLFLFPFFYPFILASSYWRYFKNLKKNKAPESAKRAVYHEQLQINIDPKNLLNRHIFVVLEKEEAWKEVDFRFESTLKSFEKIM